MGVYIKNWSLADWKELLKWAKIGANNAMIGEFAEVEELPPHGRLIDADAEIARVQNLYNKAVAKDPEMGCVSVYEGEIAVLKLAPTIIPAEEGEA